MGAGPSGGASTSSNGGAGGSISTSSGGAATGGAGGGVTPPPPDPCEQQTATCDVPAPTASGQGLVPLDRCAFALDRAPSFDSFGPLVDALETIATPVSLADVLADLNRSPVVVGPNAVPGNPPGVQAAFKWEASENSKPTWVPQGLSGSPDADATGLVGGRRVVLVSFYFDETADPAADPKGVRLALVDVTDPAAPHYRFLLLAEPAPGPTILPVTIHAGGIAWVGNLLYVADTSAGLRVFDMNRLMQVDTALDTVGCDATSCHAGLYKYIVPQIGAYSRSSTCSEKPRFSFIALDRSATPLQLVAGEYCSTAACSGPLAGRLFRYPLDSSTGLLAGGDHTWVTDAYFAGERQVQGGVSNGDAFYLSSSEPAGAGGALYRVTTQGRDAFGWIDSPEDVMIDTTAGTIFSLSEALNQRFVMEANLSSYQP